jgi:serine/threonine-protein kinase RsbW
MAHIDRVCEAVTRFIHETHPLLSCHLFAINLVIREGLTNAVRHGNRNDPGKTVDFRIQINDMKSIALRIADQGEGFDWQKQKTTGLLSDADHGRGIPIMQTYFSAYSYNSRGNILYLEKDI